MARSIRRIKIIAMMAIALAVAVVMLASQPSVVLGITSEVETRGSPTLDQDYSLLPVDVIVDAFQEADALYGANEEGKSEFINQLLAMYAAARDKDSIILFNPGGWGWRFLDDSPNWPSIFAGMEEALRDSGYKPLLLEHRRSENNNVLKNCVDEYMAIIGLYPLKARALASRLEFLTRHIPNLKIIVTGESNGTIICDQAVEILKDNPRIYSIQTGTPFWHTNRSNERILLINDNGTQPDAFSSGDFFTLISRNLEVSLGMSPSDKVEGNILFFFSAPGHAYTWQNPVVRKQIDDFLKINFPER